MLSAVLFTLLWLVHGQAFNITDDLNEQRK
jgi:hypothetical protein